MYTTTTTHLTILYILFGNSLAKNLVGHNVKLVGHVPQYD